MKNVAFFFAMIGSCSLLAQTTLLDTVTVKSSLIPQTLVQANRHVQVISGEELQSMPAQSISDILDFVAGIDARQRGPFDVQTDLSVRGSSFEQVLVLINGTRLSDPQTGHHFMNLPVAKEDIERIEILLGGSSQVFGSGAFAGSINIITKKSSRNTTQVEVSAGSHEAYQLGFSQQLSGKKSHTRFSANTAAHQGFMYNTDARNSNFWLQHTHTLGMEQLEVAAGYNQKAFGAQGFYSNRYPEQFEKTRTLFVQLGLSRKGDKSTLKRELYWRRHWDEFQLFREDEDFYTFDNGFFIKGQDTASYAPGVYYPGHNYHRSDVAGGKLHYSLESTVGITSAMAEYRFEGVLSNNLGTPLEGTYRIPGSRGTYTLGAQRNNISIALEHQYAWQKWSFNAAMLYNYNTDYPGEDFYPSLGIGYAIQQGQRLFFNANRSFRLPSYTDLYYRLGGAQGSIDLQPENSINVELGYKFNRGQHFVQGSIFRRMGTNLIDWVSYPDSTGLFAANITEVNLNGADLSYRLLGRNTGWARMRFFELGYSYYQADDSQQDFESLYVLDYLSHKATARLQFLFWEKLSFTPSFTFQQRNGTFSNTAGELVPYESVSLLNARISYSLPLRSELYVYGTNLLDQSYVDRGNVPLPGMWLWAGLKFTL